MNFTRSITRAACAAAILLAATPGARAQFSFTNIADSTSPTFSSFNGRPSINATGTVGFSGGLDAGDSGIFTGNGTTTTTIALASGSPFSSFGGNAAINSVGRVGFQANLDAGGSGLFTGNGISTTTIALVDPTFLNFQTLSSINTAGMVAFRATLSGGNGLFLGDGTTTTQVIRTGDALFGSTVSLLDVGETGLNDAGQLAFKYTLANGVSGVAVAAAVPEPGSALLLLGGAALLGLRRRR